MTDIILGFTFPESRYVTDETIFIREIINFVKPKAVLVTWLAGSQRLIIAFHPGASDDALDAIWAGMKEYERAGWGFYEIR